MKINTLTLSNYKSFYSPQTLALKTGINLIAGQNNAGKSSLLEALSFYLQSKPHRSSLTVPSPTSQPNLESCFEIDFSLTGSEVWDRLLQDGTQFYLPIPEAADPYWANLDPDSPDGRDDLLRKLIKEEEFRLKWKVVLSPNHRVRKPIAYEGFGLYEIQTEGPNVLQVLCVVLPDKSVSLNPPQLRDRESSLGSLFVDSLSQRLYAFHSERRVDGACAAGISRILNRNASNLAEVLSNLQSNPSEFRRFNEAVQQVLPQIKQVTVEYRDGQQVEILVWGEDPSLGRSDLAFSLSDSGTGVGQVLAILYVILTSVTPRTIIIDEPQSFLHPGAERKLIEKLAEFPQHQYILSTHSPSVVSISNPSTLSIVTKPGTESELHSVDPAENESLRFFLAEVGARLSDVFGADQILWVEGPTEENCFPKIIRKLLTRPLLGIAVLGVLHTGDLEGKHAKSVFEIYERLSRGSGLLPPALGFVFDREGRTQKDMDDLARRSNNSVRFIGRRLFENYLLYPEAIEAVVNSIDGFSDNNVSADQLRDWIGDRRSDKKYWKDVNYEMVLTSEWITGIHGAMLLNDLFSEFSETRVHFQKTTHSVALTDWILGNQPEELKDLGSLLANCLGV